MTMMDSAALVTLLITLAAGGLLISELLRPDLVALLVLVSLGFTGIVSRADLFSGFSGDAVITIIGISIISAALFQTGVAYHISTTLHDLSGRSEARSILLVMLVSASLSLFMNNIAAVGILLPAVMGLSRQSNISPSRLLMPLAFGTILGGMATLLTTSNIIMSGALVQAGSSAFTLLDFFPIGAPLVVIGILYMLLAGRRWLPSQLPDGAAARRQPLRSQLAGMYNLNEQLVEIEVLSGSKMAGRTISEGQWASTIGTTVVGLMRGGRMRIAPPSHELVRAGDRILAQGIPNSSALEVNGLQITQQKSLDHLLADEKVCLGEALLSPHSPLAGKSLSQARFRERYGLNVLSIWRSGAPLQGILADLPLQFGDTLLIQGPPLNMRAMHNEQDFVLLEEDPDAVLNPGKAWLAAAITLVTLAAAALGFVPLALAATAGAALVLLTGCMRIGDVYRSIEWRAVFLIAGMWPLSIAIRSTGLASLGIAFLTGNSPGLQPLVMAGMLLLLGLIITQFMGGQAAALVLAPFAISAAAALQVDPRAMAMAAALSCSLAFITPFGHPVNMMVLSSGGYKLRDFLRVGAPLTLLIFAAILAGLKLFWGL